MTHLRVSPPRLIAITSVCFLAEGEEPDKNQMLSWKGLTADSELTASSQRGGGGGDRAVDVLRGAVKVITMAVKATPMNRLFTRKHLCVWQAAPSSANQPLSGGTSVHVGRPLVRPNVSDATAAQREERSPSVRRLGATSVSSAPVRKVWISAG